VTPQPNSTLIDRLIPMWQRALGKSRIGIHDNFFELGGNGTIAERLFAEASQVAPKPLPPVMIFIAPTIASMAHLLEFPDAVAISPTILLKEGAEAPPVFMTHGLGSSVLDLSMLARGIETERPIFGLQAKGTDGKEEPYDRVEDMALFFLEAIRRIQAHGPYSMIGYSFGGLVLMEVAHRLRAQGESIALLAMVDTYPSKRTMRPVPLLRLCATLARRRVQRKLGTLKDAQRPVPTQHVQRQKDLSYVALKRYRPRPLDGEIRFVRAADVSDFPADPAPVWAHLAKKVMVETVPGNHLEMLDLHPEALAAALTRYLKATG
jgi:acetoacetyl-CoA synthetase